MFVIVQCLNNVKRSSSDQSRSVSQIISETMRHAGVSITVTSVTDILAFGVGYFTVSRLKLYLYCLLSHCLFGRTCRGSSRSVSTPR